MFFKSRLRFLLFKVPYIYTLHNSHSEELYLRGFLDTSFPLEIKGIVIRFIMFEYTTVNLYLNSYVLCVELRYTVFYIYFLFSFWDLVIRCILMIFFKEEGAKKKQILFDKNAIDNLLKIKN